MKTSSQQISFDVLPSRELTVENTTFCGAVCTMCPREDYHKRWTHMSMEMFKHVVEEGVAHGMESLDLCGFGDRRTT